MTTSSTSLTRWLAPLLLGVAGLAGTPAQATDVGVSIGFSQPGVYGRVDIGRYPQPALVAPRPVIIGRPVYREPVYLWVPPGHQRNWSKHCRQYGACGRPVYFVQDNWYREHVVVHREPAWRRDRDRRDDRHKHHHGHHDRDDRGRGHGHGHRD